MTAGRRAAGGARDWNTPPKYVAAINELLGRVHLDPCCNAHCSIEAVVEFRLPEKDGLSQPWVAPTIFVNPPYGRDPDRGTSIRDWVAKSLDAARGGAEVLMLIPVATNTRHFKESIFPFASVCFLADTRLRFYAGGKEMPRGAPMACCMVYFGHRHKEFARVFAPHGALMLHGSGLAA